MRTKEEAQKAGEFLLTALADTGPGWVLRVWENLGWHYAVENAGGLIDVHATADVDGGLTYYCMLTDDRRFPGTDSQLWHDPLEYYKSPIEAVSKKMEKAQDAVNELNKILTEVASAISGNSGQVQGQGN